MFLCSKTEFKDFFGNKKLKNGEFLPNDEKKYDLLMDGDKPEGGKWSFDAENRKKLPKNIEIPVLPKLKTADFESELKKQLNQNLPIILENWKKFGFQLTDQIL